jgi:hypothetical protein
MLLNVLLPIGLAYKVVRSCHTNQSAVVDRGVGDWGSCPGHQGRGHQRGESKNNANLHNEKHVIDFKYSNVQK